MSNQAVLVTGGAGYIGSYVAQLLIEQNLKVVILDNLSTGTKAALPDAPFVQADLRDPEQMDKLFKSYQFDSVLHFAASTSVPESMSDPSKYYDNNVAGTLELLKFCRNYAIKHFIFSSTAAVYGNTPATPVKETAPLYPVSPYGQSKLMCEKLIEDFARAYGFTYVILRYFNVAGADPQKGLGPRSATNETLINVAIRAALGQIPFFPLYGMDYPTKDGSCVRDFIHIHDLAIAHIKALNYLNLKGASSTLNCGYSLGTTVKEILKDLQQITKRPFKIEHLPRRNGDCPVVIADNTLIRSTLDWQPQPEPLTKLLNTAWEWALQNAEKMTV